MVANIAADGDQAINQRRKAPKVIKACPEKTQLFNEKDRRDAPRNSQIVLV